MYENPMHCIIHYIHMGLDRGKPVFGGLRTTKAQTSLHITQSSQSFCHSLIGKYHVDLLQAKF